MKHIIEAKELPNGSVLISPKEGGKYTLNIETNKHKISADEPENIGGDDTAPSPYEFLLSGLGTCTAITLKAYADFKKLDLGEFYIGLSQYRDNDKTLIIEKELVFHGDWSDEQLKKLNDVSHKCPMHKDLEGSGIKINTYIHAHP